MNNSDVNTGKLVADVINHRSSNHLDKYDLEKVKKGLARGRYATQSTERHAFWRRPPAKVRMSVGVLAGGCCGGFLQTLSSIPHQWDLPKQSCQSKRRKVLMWKNSW